MVAASAVKTVPCLVHFAAQATRWNFGEVLECSQAHFLAIAEDSRG